MAEDQKVIIRNIRRDIHDEMKKAEKDKEISQDELKRGEGRLQKATDIFVAQVDEGIEVKEAELKQI